jgi:hypothetical protein
LNNKMGNGKDFDIGVFDNVTGEGNLSLTGSRLSS